MNRSDVATSVFDGCDGGALCSPTHSLYTLIIHHKIYTLLTIPQTMEFANPPTNYTLRSPTHKPYNLLTHPETLDFAHPPASFAHPPRNTTLCSPTHKLYTWLTHRHIIHLVDPPRNTTLCSPTHKLYPLLCKFQVGSPTD